MSKSRGLLFSVIGTLLALALIATAAFFAYRVGLNQGILAGESINFDELPYTAPFIFPHKYAHPHMGFGGLFFGLIFLVIIVGLVKKLFFFSWFGGRYPYGLKGYKHWHAHCPPWYMGDEDQADDAAGKEKEAA